MACIARSRVTLRMRRITREAHSQPQQVAPSGMFIDMLSEKLSGRISCEVLWKELSRF
jgi:hypothetical protein